MPSHSFPELLIKCPCTDWVRTTQLYFLKIPEIWVQLIFIVLKVECWWGQSLTHFCVSHSLPTFFVPPPSIFKAMTPSLFLSPYLFFFFSMSGAFFLPLFLLSFFPVLGTILWSPHIIGSLSTTELHCQLYSRFILSRQIIALYRLSCEFAM